VLLLKNSRVKKGVQWTDKTDGNHVAEQREGFRCMTGIKKGRNGLSMKIWKNLFPVEF
jgi:hypothetical protein